MTPLRTGYSVIPASHRTQHSMIMYVCERRTITPGIGLRNCHCSHKFCLTEENGMNLLHPRILLRRNGWVKGIQIQAKGLDQRRSRVYRKQKNRKERDGRYGVASLMSTKKPKKPKQPKKKRIEERKDACYTFTSLYSSVGPADMRTVV